MLLVGLTGNIASGKSTVARLLAAHGATIVDADLLARQAVRPGSPAFQQIVERWGKAILAPDGTLDRAALRVRVFDDPVELVDQARKRGDRIVVCDIPLLFERNLVDEFDVVMLVDAPRELRLERLVRDRDLREADAMAMIAAQMPAELKRARADIVVDNADTPAALAERVAAVWAMLQRRALNTTAELAAQREERRTSHEAVDARVP